VLGPNLSLQQPLAWVLTTGAAAEEAIDPVAMDELAEDDLDLTLSDPTHVELTTPAAGRKRLPLDAGLLVLTQTEEALVITLETRDATVSPRDFWDLFFDCRPADQRYGLYDRGVFALTVFPQPAPGAAPRCFLSAGPAQPQLTLTGTATAEGTRLTLSLPWQHLGRLAGPVTGFRFAASLACHPGGDDPKQAVRVRHLFGGPHAHALTVGWAGVYRGPVPAGAGDIPAVARPFIEGERPADWRSGGAAPAKAVAPEIALAPRVHPLTGELGRKVYRSGTWSCGGPSYSASCVFRRPSKPAIGIYDFADDSGLRFLSGVGSPCGSSSIAAQGLLIFSDSRFRCDCSPPIKTSLALAPAQRRYQEDWAVFYDEAVTTRVRHARLNLGAFGDRRDTGRQLWLSFPRNLEKAFGYALVPPEKGRVKLYRKEGSYLRHVPAGLLVPAEMTFLDGYGPYRRSADRVAIDGTEAPWIYASGVEGIEAAAIKLDLISPVLAGRVAPPALDGDLGDPAWAGAATWELPQTGAAVRLRHTADALVVAVSRPALVDRKGTTYPWRRETTGEDAEVWRDDGVELFLGTRDAARVLHLGLSISGARYDALVADGAAREDPAFSGDWKAAVIADADGMRAEFSVPFALLQAAGIAPGELAANVLVNQSDTRTDIGKYPGGEGRNWNLKNPTSEAPFGLGDGRHRCRNLAAVGLEQLPHQPSRTFTVRLHFAELADTQRGQRVFDVVINGNRAIADLDIAAAGGVRRAVVKTVSGVTARSQIELLFRPHADSQLPPIVSGVEILDEAERGQRLGERYSAGGRYQ
jgi:hypothetical protein